MSNKSLEQIYHIQVHLDLVEIVMQSFYYMMIQSELLISKFKLQKRMQSTFFIFGELKLQQMRLELDFQVQN